MYLVNDEDFVLARLRGYVCLLHELLDVFHAVVGGGIKLEDVEGASFIEGFAAFALSAGIAGGGGGEAVDDFCEDACAGGLSHAAWSAKEVGMCQFAAGDGILQCRSKCGLTYYAVECHGAVFPG